MQTRERSACRRLPVAEKATPAGVELIVVIELVYVKPLSGVGYVSVKRTNLSHSRQWFNTLIPTVAGGRSLYTVVHLQWSRLTVPVELSTRYTTPDTTTEIGSTSATVE